MKILCTSMWKNSWIPYWTKFLEGRGHEVRWLTSPPMNYRDSKDLYEWCDAVLSHWAIGWPNLFTSMKFTKPLFVIHRSFECFNDTQAGMHMADVDWKFVRRLFVLNESHLPLIMKSCPDAPQPTFIKNGVDLDFWKGVRRESSHNIAWVANLNHKKGEMLAAHAMAAIQQVDPLVRLYHIGKIDSTRIELYLNNIMPYLKTTFWCDGFVKGSEKVREWLLDKRFIISCSLVEGHPLNILEAMAMGCKPLIHRYPGVEHQFPEKYIWNSFEDLVRIYQEPYAPDEYRSFIEERYDYRKCYEPVALAIEECKDR